MTVRVGIIGCGKITEKASLPNLVNYTGKAEVRCLCDIVRERAEEKKRAFNVEGADIETNWKKVIKRKDIDAIFVNTPNYLHERMAVAAARRKKHILVEKPITISNKAARNMVNAARKSGVFFMVEQTQRFDPVHQAAKKVIESGRLGRINMIKGRIGHAGPEYWSEGKSNWFYNRKLSGGGAMIDVGIHILDLIRWLSGKEVAEVMANIRTVEKDIPVDDNGNVLLRFTDGTVGIFECSWTTRPYEVMTFTYGQNGKMVTSIGAEKPVVVKMAAVEKGQDPNCLQEEVYPEVGPGGGWENSVHYFIDCVREGKEPFINGEEGAKSMAVILAAYESSKKGKWVKV